MCHSFGIIAAQSGEKKKIWQIKKKEQQNGDWIIPDEEGGSYCTSVLWERFYSTLVMRKKMCDAFNCQWKVALF